MISPTAGIRFGNSVVTRGGRSKYLKLALDRPPEHKQNTTRKFTFDIGRVTQSRSFQSEDTETLTAYRFLRFCEEAGVPFRMPGCTIATKTAAGALSRVAPQSPYWAMATLIRLNDATAVERLFDRASVARMDTASVDGLVDRYLRSLDLALADIQAGTHFWDQSLGILLAKVVPENPVEIVLQVLAQREESAPGFSHRSVSIRP